MKKRTNVQAVRVDLICDGCLQPLNRHQQAYMTNPITYVYFCNHSLCAEYNMKVTDHEMYPSIEYVDQ